MPWKSNAEVLREAREWYLAHNPSLPLPESLSEQPQELPEWQRLKQSWSATPMLSDANPRAQWPPQGHLPSGYVIDEDGLVRLDRASPDG